VVIAFLEKKYNMETLRNRYQISMFQGGPLHKPYFIAISNIEQIIIGPSKNIVAIHIMEELVVMV